MGLGVTIKSGWLHPTSAATRSRLVCKELAMSVKFQGSGRYLYKVARRHQSCGRQLTRTILDAAQLRHLEDCCRL